MNTKDNENPPSPPFEKGGKGGFSGEKFGLLIIYVTLIWGLNGCAVLNAINQRSTLSSATEMIKKGEDDVAIVLLEEICSKKGVKGITDEALFRLGLLYLDHKPRTEGLTKAYHILERLHKEYPGSEWNIQSAPLLKFLKETISVRRKIEELEESNTSLLKENKKLNLDIEKLKTLDLELEEKQSP